ncbi:MAG: ADP-ribosyltransferase [Peptococcia bacterium]|jgi:hypothetical protein
MFPSVKTKAIKTLSGVLLLLILLQCFPGFALGYDLDVHARIRNFVSAQVENSNNIIEPNRLKIKTSVNKGTAWIGNKYRDGFLYLENKTGLNENQKPYKAVKNYTLHNVGFNLGLVNGAGTIASEIYSLAAKLPTAPERIANFSYKYAEDPEKYHTMASGVAQAVGGAILDPLPYLNGLYQYGKSTYSEAAKDPLTLGILHGEATALVASLVLPVGKTKPLTAVSKLEKATKVESSGKLPYLLSSLNAIALKNSKFTPQVVCMSATSAKVGTKTGKVSGQPFTKLIDDLHLDDMLVAGNYQLPEATEKALIRWGNAQYRRARPKLTDADIEFIEHYTENAGYFNSLLRRTYEFEGLSIADAKEVNRLSEILGYEPLRRNRLFFRGTDRNALGKYANSSPEELVGKHLRDEAFISTSLLPIEASAHAYGVMFVINAPKGTKGLYIDKLSLFKGEHEFLLDKGMEMVIRNAVQGKRDLILFADLLQPPKTTLFGATSAAKGSSAISTVSAVPNSLTKTGTAYPFLELSGLERTFVAAQYNLPDTITKRIISWAEHTYSGWFEKLSPADKGIILDYTWASGKYNRFLRGKTKETPSAEQMAKINRLSEILSTAPPLEQKIVVFRGTTASILGKNLKGLPIKQLPGKEIIDQGFLSACLIPSPARKLAESKLYSEKVFLTINVPPGAKGAYIGRQSANPDELEFLLDKGQRLRINKATKIDQDLVLDVDVL